MSLLFDAAILVDTVTFLSLIFITREVRELLD